MGISRLSYAVVLEEARIKKAPDKAVEKVKTIFATGPEPIKAHAIIALGMERGDISPQEGVELTNLVTGYQTLGLAERIVVTLALMELVGVEHSGVRPPILA